MKALYKFYREQSFEASLQCWIVVYHSMVYVKDEINFNVVSVLFFLLFFIVGHIVIIGSLSTRVFETRTATGREYFAY